MKFNNRIYIMFCNKNCYNCSMVKDGILNIAYYENGMPKSINKSATEQVYYTFDAIGNKLRTNYYNKDSLYYYNDGIEYKGTVNPKLYYISTEDGYIDSTLQYNYYLKDHLGNIRKVLNATTRTVTQSTNYYPFGLVITTTGTSKNKYLYNGKEIQPSNGYYDYGARMYDASVGRWFVVDPLAEKFIGLNAYVYCANNPILLADPNGKDWSISASQNKEGNWTINIHFKAQILNSSGKEVDTKSLAEAAKSQFENAFNNIFKNDDGTTITVNASANISVINKKEDLANDATLIDIRNKNDENFKNINSNITAGVALNGKEILLNESQVNSFINGKNKRTIPHEIGHTAGLNHPSSDIEQIIPRQIPYIGDPKGNLMNQGIHQISPYNDKIFTFPTKGQINRIYSLYSNGYLNTNKSTIKVPTPFQINKF